MAHRILRKCFLRVVVRVAKILIADDHAVVLMSLRLLLEQAGHEVVGQAHCGFDVISMARLHSPDLIVLDIDMPQLDGFSVLKRLSAAGLNCKVVVFTALNSEQYAPRCARSGAAGFASKASDLSELLTVVQVVLAGYTLFPAVKASSVDSQACTMSEAALVGMLSPRELLVLRYLARGERVGKIAELMFISIKTVSTYKARLMEKLQLNSLAALIDFAKRNNLL